MSDQLAMKISWFLRGLYEFNRQEEIRRVAAELLVEIESERMLSA